MILKDNTHILFLDGIWFASRGEWHQTGKKAHDNESSYWIDVLIGDNRTARLEYDAREERDLMWDQLCVELSRYDIE